MAQITLTFDSYEETGFFFGETFIQRGWNGNVCSQYSCSGY
mgnify:CR=1 FL=1